MSGKKASRARGKKGKLSERERKSKKGRVWVKKTLLIGWKKEIKASGVSEKGKINQI